MFKRIRLLSLIGSALLATAACTVIDNSLSPRVSTLNFAIDRATNDAILTNLVRASRSQPLTFLAISKVGGSQQATLTMGLPSFHFGPDLTSIQKQFSFSNNTVNQNASGTFDVAPLAGRDFTKGLMLPLSMQEIELLLRQGLPRELLFNLIFESMEYVECNRKTIYPHYSKAHAPCGPGSPTPEDLKPRQCVGRHRVVTHANGEKFRLAEAAFLLDRHAFNVESRREIDPFAKQRGNNSSSVSPTIVNSRFCFDQHNAAGFKFSDTWQCGTSWYYYKDALRPPVTNPNLQSTLFRDEVIWVCLRDPTPIKNVKLNVRSINGIFRFLGTLLASEETSLLTVSIDATGKRYPLLHVEKGRVRGCFASVEFDNEHYCIPEEGSPATKLVFSVLAQLIALKTQPGDLPFTPTVRIAP